MLSYPAVSLVKEALRYDNGKLFWLERPREHFSCDQAMLCFNTRNAHKEAGYEHCDWNKGTTRWFVGFFGQDIFRSILVWALHHDAWPTEKLDHIDRNSLNDVCSNLRIATSSQNGANSVLSIRNKSGAKGVSFHRASGKWQASITVNTMSIHIGLYNTVQEGAAAYYRASQHYFGPFACSG